MFPQSQLFSASQLTFFYLSSSNNLSVLDEVRKNYEVEISISFKLKRELAYKVLSSVFIRNFSGRILTMKEHQKPGNPLEPALFTSGKKIKISTSR